MPLHVTITSQIVLKDCFQENKTAGSGCFSLVFCEKCQGKPNVLVSSKDCKGAV